MDSLTRLGTVLVVWAHPDDETYLVGGLSAALTDAGQRVVCVTATRGEAGGTDPDLADIRTAELETALALLGVRVVEPVVLPHAQHRERRVQLRRPDVGEVRVRAAGLAPGGRHADHPLSRVGQGRREPADQVRLVVRVRPDDQHGPQAGERVVHVGQGRVTVRIPRHISSVVPSPHTTYLSGMPSNDGSLSRSHWTCRQVTRTTSP